ncbi:MAG: DUF2079 domain-containing protein [Jaaginema sp. PMC 1079.18]|nr:DUF2079 domain-containing protein [Jaaginema sp. PMC 1080.18]MEC4853681.1 DUF2079 domain-containing protein [Jaaginema sp. PMC 1079.18]MEC4867354.1 DUF2079 domain-containing protein [Jaaginema sp. PMC 1078.18]
MKTGFLRQNDRFIGLLVVFTTLFLFCCSSLRHALLKSNAFDLGLFDQFVYLLSQGLPPVVSLAGYHFLGDHAAFIFYAIALLYKIYPDVHWLFLLQAASLALGSGVVWLLAQQAQLETAQARIVAIAYLLYPVIFNANLYDFHGEVIAVPAILGAVWSARAKKPLLFLGLILLTLSCKAVLSLTVAAMGIWLWRWEQRRGLGLLALGLGITWFAIATQWLIPSFLTIEHNAVSRYAYLGNSIGEIVLNLFLKPQLVCGRIFSGETWQYLALLGLPVAWGLSWLHLAPFFCALPTLAMNILSDASSQRNLVMQYSLPIVPFLFVALISTWQHHRVWLKSRRLILTWSAIAFLALAKYGYFWTIYLDSLDTWSETRNAIALVNTSRSLLTLSHISPHLTHRQNIQLATFGSESLDLLQFHYILLSQRNPNWQSSPATLQALLEKIATLPQFQPLYQQKGVVLFAQINPSALPSADATPNPALNGRGRSKTDSRPQKAPKADNSP